MREPAVTLGAAVPRVKPRRPKEVRDPYDGLRPWSAITHGVGAVLAVVGTAFLAVQSILMGKWGNLAVFLIYGLSMVCLYTASTLYHCVNTSRAKRIALRQYDHCSIYLLIAGSYTPICLTVLRTVGAWGWALFSIIWVLALAGIVLTMGWINMPRQLTAAIYISMGWMAVVAVYPLYQTVGWTGLSWLLAGGVLYTVGGVSYALKWPGRDNPRFRCHDIFHVFIVLVSICPFLLMYRVVCFL